MIWEHYYPTIFVRNWICPSLRSLVEMVKIFINFATDFNVTFNPKKTVCKIIESDQLFIDGYAIEWKNHVKHLGNIVNITLTDENDCALKMSSFNGAVNKLIGNYGGLPISCGSFDGVV